MLHHRRTRALLFLLLCSILSVPLLMSAQEGSSGQEISITDSRSGASPCGFVVQRELEGTLTVESSLDTDGRLVLAITGVDVTGTLTNPANGQSVAIILVRHNGEVGISERGHAIEVTMGLSGWFHRGYDTADAQLALSLPADDADVLDVIAGERYEDPWAQVCSLLA